MNLESKLESWTGPSSDTEKEKQERTERMIREAVSAHLPFANCTLRVFAKGSYANNTNVRADSDVDIAVECTEAEYWGEAITGTHVQTDTYKGPWTPEKLRNELVAALSAKFGKDVDCSGSTAIRVHSSTARIEADVVSCFSYRYYFEGGGSRAGTKLFKKNGAGIVNYPVQQLANGTSKNKRTGYAYKKIVRILKRAEIAMAEQGYSPVVPSYFLECLPYNCPDAVFNGSSWTQIVRAVLIVLWNALEGDEPIDNTSRWREVNGCFYLFHSGQKWTRSDGRAFAQNAWNYLGFS